MSQLSVVSPVNGEVYVERSYANEAQIAAALSAGQRAGENWRRSSVEERAAIVLKAVDIFVVMKSVLA